MIERDVLRQMDFAPGIAADLKQMDARIFRPELMGLAGTAAGA
jgi:propionate CoA-transferase